jgi:hypothetical protein
MGRKSKTQQLTDSILGQHLSLSVAAHLARTQLVPDPLTVYDAQHMSEMIDVIGNALARVVPLYAPSAMAGQPQQLMEGELEGARVMRGAMLLVLKDGRSLTGVSVKRADLRQAIAILKAVGIQELVPRKAPPELLKAQEPDRLEELQKQLAEVEILLRLPLVPGQVDRANAVLVSVARNAPAGRIANHAMRLMSAVHDACHGISQDERQIEVLLARLRATLEEAAAAALG